ncbi:MAG: MFS transporter [Eubacteriales bacterium]|nr:MFS transporter [Eubacteriales bacterium]
MNQKKTGLGFKLLFSTKTVFVCVMSALMGYVTLYATDYMQLSPGIVGVAFMISKIFDGFTDFVAGAIIDRTHTKLGQARPYDLAIIGYGVAVILIFSAPNVGETQSLIYLFVMYTIINSVFSTLITCNEAPYLSNAIDDTRKGVDIVSFSSVVSLIFSLIAAVATPQLIATYGTTKEGWRIIALMLVVPFTIIGMLRFIFIKEIRAPKRNEGEKTNLKEDLILLVKNKYAILFSIILLISNICSNISNMNYYCIYFMNDIGVLSIISLSVLLVIFIMMIMPVLSKKFGTVNVIKVFAIIGAAGYMIKMISPSSVPLAFVSCMLSNLGFYPAWFIANSIMIDAMDYGEWKFGRRTQGTISCLTGIASKLGTAIGAGLIGVLLEMAHYDGSLDVQPGSAMSMIMALVTYIPAILCIVMAVTASFYDLDKKLPQIREELEVRRQANGN